MSRRLLVSILTLSAAISSACSGERFVDSVVIDNPTAFTARVDVTDDERAGWVGLATVQPESDATVRDVLDHGEKWIFRFSYAGHEEEIELTRAELDQARWRVEIPASFETELRQSGVPPPP